MSLSAVQDLFSVFSSNGIIGSTELRVKYEKPPIETAKKILDNAKMIGDVASASPIRQLSVYAFNPLNVLYNFLRDIQAIAQKADQEGAKAQNDKVNTGELAGTESLSEAALASLGEIYTQLESMEVYENAVD